MHQQRHHRRVSGDVTGIELGADHAFDHGVDGLEVARVRGERHADRSAREAGIGAGGAEVVLHVTRSLYGTGRHVLELPEQRGNVLADDIDQGVEPTSVGHPDDHFADVRRSG